jgi:hypothetical protein
MLLYITIASDRMKNMIDILNKMAGGKGNNYILFRTLPHLSGIYKPPVPQPELYLEPWYRAGEPPFFINKP